MSAVVGKELKLNTVVYDPGLIINQSAQFCLVNLENFVTLLFHFICCQIIARVVSYLCPYRDFLH